MVTLTAPLFPFYLGQARPQEGRPQPCRCPNQPPGLPGRRKPAVLDRKAGRPPTGGPYRTEPLSISSIFAIRPLDIHMFSILSTTCFY